MRNQPSWTFQSAGLLCVRFSVTNSSSSTSTSTSSSSSSSRRKRSRWRQKSLRQLILTLGHQLQCLEGTKPLVKSIEWASTGSSLRRDNQPEYHELVKIDGDLHTSAQQATMPEGIWHGNTQRRPREGTNCPPKY